MSYLPNFKIINIFLKRFYFKCFFNNVGKNILNDAVHNKGLGYTHSERDRLELRGQFW